MTLLFFAEIKLPLTNINFRKNLSNTVQTKAMKIAFESAVFQSLLKYFFEIAFTDVQAALTISLNDPRVSNDPIKNLFG